MPTWAMRASLIASLLSLLLGSSARAEPPSRDRIRYHLGADLAVTATITAAWVASAAVFVAPLAPDSCRWCASNRLDRAAREALLWEDPALAARLGDGISYVATPLVGGALLVFAAADAPPSWRRTGVDVLLVLQATVAAGLMQHGGKVLFGRERPNAHVLPADRKHEVPRAEERNLSFWSGHVATSMALGTSSATVAWLRGYPTYRWLWMPSAALAVAAGYLRMASDDHWATDAAAGLVIGGSVGFAIPFFFHRADRPPAVVLPAPVAGGGLMLMATGTM